MSFEIVKEETLKTYFFDCIKDFQKYVSTREKFLSELKKAEKYLKCANRK